MKVNDWGFLERLVANGFQRIPVSAFGLWLLDSILRSQRSTVSRAGSSAAALSFAVCRSAVPNNRPSST